MGTEKVNNRKKNIPRVLREKNKIKKDQILTGRKKTQKKKTNNK